MIDMNKLDLIAKNMGFRVRRSSKYNTFYYYEDAKGESKTNAKGESLIVEITHCSDDCKSKHSLPIIWQKMDYTKELIPEWWDVTIYSSDKNGNCYGRYNPTHKRSDDGKRFAINFDWHLLATEENVQLLLTEILRRFNNETHV